jgi:hypothetical protein
MTVLRWVEALEFGGVSGLLLVLCAQRIAPFLPFVKHF